MQKTIAATLAGIVLIGAGASAALEPKELSGRDLVAAQERYYAEHGRYLQVLKGNGKPHHERDTAVVGLKKRLSENTEVHVYETPSGQRGFQVIEELEDRIVSTGYGPEAAGRTSVSFKATTTPFTLSLAPFRGLFDGLVPHAYAGGTNTHATDLEGSSSQSWTILDASQSGLDITGNLSISLWVKLESQPVGGGAYLVSKFVNSGQFAYRFLYDQGSGLYFSNSSTGSNNSGGFIAGDLSTATWTHVGVSKSGTSATIYVNGSSVGSVTVLSSTHNGTDPFGIGATVDIPFDGIIDDVIVYNAAIGDAGMSTNYTTPCTPHLTNAVSRWKFDNDGNDAIGTNNLTNNNSATFTTDTAYDCAEPVVENADLILFN